MDTVIDSKNLRAYPGSVVSLRLSRFPAEAVPAEQLCPMRLPTRVWGGALFRNFCVPGPCMSHHPELGTYLLSGFVSWFGMPKMLAGLYHLLELKQTSKLDSWSTSHFPLPYHFVAGPGALTLELCKLSPVVDGDK